MLDSKQAGSRAQVLLAWGISLAALGFAVFVGFHWPRLAEPTLVQRIAYALQWDLLLVLPLLTSAFRLGHPKLDAVEEEGEAARERLLALHDGLQGSLALAVIAFMVHLAWAVAMPAQWLLLLPAAACLFFGGRQVCLIGYPDGPGARALGFGLSFYASALMFAAIVLYKAASLLSFYLF